jgi:hypothetical protein
MADEVKTRTPEQIVKQYRKELTKALRAEGRRVVKEIQRGLPKGRTGNLRKKVKIRVKFDSDGPYVRITTSARRRTKDEDTGKVTTFRYGLAIQQKQHYLQRGLQRTPRR